MKPFTLLAALLTASLGSSAPIASNTEVKSRMPELLVPTIALDMSNLESENNKRSVVAPTEIRIPTAIEVSSKRSEEVVAPKLVEGPLLVAEREVLAPIEVLSL